MFKSYHKVLLSTVLVVAATSTTALAGDKSVSTKYANGKYVIDGGATYPVTNGRTSSYFVNEKTSTTAYSFGRKPTDSEIKAWDIDVMPDGTGLPEGKGTAEEGDEIYENAGFRKENHIQLCIKNPNCIIGYFRPKSMNSHYKIV